VLARVAKRWAFTGPGQEPASSEPPEGVISFLLHEGFVREVAPDKLEITSDGTEALSAAERALAGEALKWLRSQTLPSNGS
jgi:hypothetical protein